MLTNGELTMETAKLKPIINSMKAEDALSIAAEAAAQIAAANASILKPTAKIELIAIGSSTGGTEALATVLPALRPPLPPIVIVQHIPVGFSKLFADRINKECILSVKEAEDGDIAKANSVYIAPGGLHMSVKKWEGTIKILTELVRDGLLTVQAAAQRAGLTEDEFRNSAKEILSSTGDESNDGI